MRLNRLFNRHSIIALAAMLGLGTGSATIAQAKTADAVTVPHKASNVKIKTKHKTVREVGGLSLASMGNPGMTPKQYGQIVGTGGKKKSNKNRYAHNAKLKRRGVC